MKTSLRGTRFPEILRVNSIEMTPSSTRIAYILFSTTNTSSASSCSTAGHRRTVTRDDLEREQLFIGKLVACAECGPGA